ncbi:MAG: hypothetical protein IJA89_06265 [Clostridia bacterium]|nr:hypothetical protein [Clostridia bacterium]
MMKILIFGFSKISYMPYARFYLENLDIQNNEVHFVFWNRDLKEENVDELSGIDLHEFAYYQEDDCSKLKKIKGFSRYRKYALKKLKEINPDFIIVLHTLPGVLLANKLTKKFKGKYIFDYRDFTYEDFLPFKKIVHRLVGNAHATFVSSDAFRKFLPNKQSNIYTSHNILSSDLNYCSPKKELIRDGAHIRISFWGFIRHEELNREIIRKISQDDRFELHYYGREQQIALNLKKYATDLGSKNIFFHGAYLPQERYIFAEKTDIIHNIYCDKNMSNAMANKYYDGLVFKIPQICMQNSYMGIKAESNGIGKQVDPYSDNFCDALYDYFSQIEEKSFFENIEKEHEKIVHEYNSGTSFLKVLLSNSRDKGE